MSKSQVFGSLWLAWLLAFGTIEYFGYRAGHQELTDWVRWATFHPVIRYPFAGFMVWLVVHMVGRVRAW